MKALLLSGKKVTAKEGNSITKSNDFRKVISDLRKQGWNIVDLRLPDNRKLYWLASNDRQGELFPAEAGGNEE
ncbi:AbrB family transcriptional regulator [Parabacteroides sp. PF5-9]|uniref:AbrB family transcriptional regulator n=1 Tax=Parabacteroides sp. PF5-9 TaxID=1742404 RepID=UPI0024731312|nr:AbrB family transcriptional regulator [Parabacteroides sp. PF5-9]